MIVNDDLENVNRSLRGDRGAFDRLVEKYQKPIFNLALRMMRDVNDAEDVTQGAFLKAYERLGSFDPQYKFFSWLYRIGVNEALNLIKQQSRFESLPEDVAAESKEGGDEDAIDQERRIQDGLMLLKADHRAVIVLKHFQGLSYEEIAQVLDLPQRKVKSRLFSARHILKEILKRKGLG